MVLPLLDRGPSGIPGVLQKSFTEVTWAVLKAMRGIDFKKREHIGISLAGTIQVKIRKQ